MSSYLKLCLAALFPVILSAIFYLLEKKVAAFNKIKRNVRQVIYGVSFGILAIIGTEWGIPMNGAQVNCRDAAVLAAGLGFGAPAGIIAGIIGGVERWVAVAWGVGTFTRVACTVSTVFAGFYAAMIRKWMFEDKKPGWLISFAVGIVMEVLHLTMVFVTNMDTPDKAMKVVASCSAPMIIANGLSVLLSAVVLSVLSGISNHKTIVWKEKSQTNISQTIQRWLLVTVVLAFAATSYFVFSLQDQIAISQTDDLLTVGLNETVTDFQQISGSKDSDYVGVANNRHIGKSGFLVLLNADLETVSQPDAYQEADTSSLKAICFATDTDETYSVVYDGVEFRAKCKSVDGYRLIALLPEAEAVQTRNIVLYVNVFMEILVFAVMFALIYMLIRRVVVSRIESINRSLGKIASGNLNEVVDVRSNSEFSSLSDDINRTVDTLKRYIDEAAARIDQELEVAKNIQMSALPGVFPAFPKRKDFDIYARTDPAKEVGGDFYDFYFTEKDMLHILIADVSGKGIPAAMFMMRAKTELKSLSETGMSIDDVFTNGNRALCEGNDAGMFVTAWQGSVDLSSGKVTFANAGHNPPLLRHANGTFEYLKTRPGLVLAGMDGMKYRKQELDLVPGDILFLYTDGVTEATNANKELYGEDRLQNCLNSGEWDEMQELCRAVKADVDAFVGEAPQFDDLTMLALRFIGPKPIPEIEFEEATLEDIPAVTEFAENELQKLGCTMKTVVKVQVAIDEIFSNIVRYGYGEKKGPIGVKIIEKEDGKTVCIRFTDEGIPYNPLTKEDPDTTLSAEERKIGGLGIFIVKKSMDDIKYKYENGRNILTVYTHIA